MKYLLIAVLTFCATTRAAVFPKGPSGLHTSVGPIGPHGRGIGHVGWGISSEESDETGESVESWESKESVESVESAESIESSEESWEDQWKRRGGWGPKKGVILKGPSGAITRNGPVGPSSRGEWHGEGRWPGNGQWRGGSNGIILKGPSGATTKTGPVGPTAVGGVGAPKASTGNDGQWSGDAAWENNDGQWKDDGLGGGDNGTTLKAASSGAVLNNEPVGINTIVGAGAEDDGQWKDDTVNNSASWHDKGVGGSLKAKNGW